ncbi:anti-anti-sigma regulatory factor-like protein [Planomonospora sphaerica]|uniref:Anti-sigma factor antagonist n=1 Tax=Planomonospora sphaerica TaxID=161355 RepID=A0A171DQV4_9ACTN|nr:STAS domain-containing protein [Planomonospora sphaerica]GAT71436.1 anti-anti-sigma regulatory factor-like protein [Planomonospora sphaerica]
MTPAPGRTPAFTASAGLHDDAVIVRAIGELDLAAAPILREQVERIWALPEVAVLIMDLSELTFCDSTGLSVLVAALRRSRERGTRFLLAGVGGRLARILALTGLDEAFTRYPDVTTALQAAAGRSAQRDGDRASGPDAAPAGAP